MAGSNAAELQINHSAIDRTRHALVLLSVKCLLEMALKEYRATSMNMLLQVEVDYEEIIFELRDKVIQPYEAIIQEFQTHIIQDTASAAADIMLAVFHLSRCDRTSDPSEYGDVKEAAIQYERLGHPVFGMMADAGLRPIWHNQPMTMLSESVDIFGRDRWYLACHLQDYQLLDHLQNVSSESLNEACGNYAATPFAWHIAAARGDTHCFQFSRRAPSKVWDSIMRAVDQEDNTCLALAAKYDHADVVDLICQYCSLETLNFIWAKKVPLHTAVYNDCPEVVKCFIKHLAELIPEALDYASDARNLPSPFWYAVRSEVSKIIRLLEPFADVDRECRGLMPLMMAVQEDNSYIVEYLLSLTSADGTRKRVNASWVHQETGHTPLQYAIRKGFSRCITLLATHNARPTISNNLLFHQDQEEGF
ncbi:ankyrin [Lizonia empirigonia]|nr:ankyrin [Lizonia empirigonia]